MKKTLLAFLLAFSILISVLPITYAFPDTDGHWAQEYIDRAVEAQLFNGVTEDRFAPDETMTRAMFVTVLGRFEGIDVEHWSREGAPQFFKQDTDNEAYYAPHIRWGVCNGIVNGINDFLFAPNRDITREQMAKLISYYLDAMGHTLTTEIAPIDENTETPGVSDPDMGESAIFADEDEISAWALDSVLRLYNAGILTGFIEEDGTVTFRPQATATRAQCATVFCRVLDSMIRSEEIPVTAQEISLNKEEVTLSEGYSFRLNVTTAPDDIPVLWRSSDTSVVTVDQEGLVTFVGPGYADVSVYTRDGLYDSCSFICEGPTEDEDPEIPDTGDSSDPGDDETGKDDESNSTETKPSVNLPNASYSKEQKSILMFGESVKDPRLYYSTAADAEADMVKVDIRTWDLRSNGEKYTRYWTLTVHKSLAETVKTIFEEIYNGPEQFPIHLVYCYSWSGKSEHSIGSAIDINWDENYYCDPYGNAIVGNFWKPGENPYSISPEGDLAKTFIKYGYIWGINWNSGYKDYMHFSFFGT